MGLETIGTLISVVGSVVGGITAMQNANAEAKMAKQRGDEELASAERKASERRREARLAASRTTALAAASGGMASDPTVTSILAGIDERGTYNSLAEIYQGKTARENYYAQASMLKRKGAQAMAGSIFSGLSGAMSGLSQSSNPYQLYGYG